jgi:hypothetical protein
MGLSTSRKLATAKKKKHEFDPGQTMRTLELLIGQARTSATAWMDSASFSFL